VPPEDAAERLSDLISAPLEELIVALGSGIGRSQAELDRHSIETQRRIDEDPTLAQYGLSATWYQIPRTELELRIAVGMQGQEPVGEQEEVTPAPPPGAPVTEFVAGRVLPAVPRLWVEPVNARYQNQFAYDTRAASTMRLEVVPVPPPGPVATTPPRMSREEVVAAASDAEVIGTPGEAALWVEQGAGWRTTANFNPGLRAWFVVQTREEDDKVRLRALVKIDDATGDVLKTVKQE
jgi:hypothetical protein